MPRTDTAWKPGSRAGALMDRVVPAGAVAALAGAAARPAPVSAVAAARAVLTAVRCESGERLALLSVEAPRS